MKAIDQAVPSGTPFTGSDWSDWWINVILVLGYFISRKLDSFKLDYNAVSTNIIYILSSNLPGCSALTPEQVDKLRQISGSCFLLAVSARTHSTELARSILPYRHRFIQSTRWAEWDTLMTNVYLLNHLILFFTLSSG